MTLKEQAIQAHLEWEGSMKIRDALLTKERLSRFEKLFPGIKYIPKEDKYELLGWKFAPVSELDQICLRLTTDYGNIPNKTYYVYDLASLGKFLSEQGEK